MKDISKVLNSSSLFNSNSTDNGEKFQECNLKLIERIEQGLENFSSNSKIKLEKTTFSVPGTFIFETNKQIIHAENIFTSVKDVYSLCKIKDDNNAIGVFCLDLNMLRFESGTIKTPQFKYSIQHGNNFYLELVGCSNYTGIKR